VAGWPPNQVGPSVRRCTVRLVDRQQDRVHESRALGVQPCTLELLRQLGVAQELIGRGNGAVWVQLHAGGRVVRIRLSRLGLDDTAGVREGSLPEICQKLRYTQPHSASRPTRSQRL
jgi:FAD binding domain